MDEFDFLENERILIEGKLGENSEPGKVFKILWARRKQKQGLSARDLATKLTELAIQKGEFQTANKEQQIESKINSVYQHIRTLRSFLTTHNKARSKDRTGTFQYEISLSSEFPRSGYQLITHQIASAAIQPEQSTSVQEFASYLKTGNPPGPSFAETESLAPTRELNEAIGAFKEVDWEAANRYLTKYYRDHGVDVFAYPRADGPPVKVPLLEPWKQVCEVETTFTDRLVEPQRTAFEAAYERIVPELRKGLGLTDPRTWNSPVFRLVKVVEKGPHLTFAFERTDFFSALVTQYCLEYEVVLALGRYRRKETKELELRHRDTKAGDTANILRFWETRPCRIGVSNLCLLRMSDDEYVPLLGERSSSSSMSNVSKDSSKTRVRQFDPPSSGILDIHSRYPNEFDRKLRHKVLTEIGEEVFGGERWAEDLVKPHEGPLMPDWFYTQPNGKECMIELVNLLNRGSAVFQVTGVCIDLMRIVPEITTLTLVKDKSYLNTYHGLFKPSRKYREHTGYTHKIKLPVKTKDFARFITEEILSDPDSHEGKRGFDPQYYTLPGGYCFFQGLKRAVELGLS